MRNLLRFATLLVLILPAFICPFISSDNDLPDTEPTETALINCLPTHDDGLSPSYKPNAPERSVVGQGHVVTGVVRSSRDCKPIAGVKLEFWSESPSQGHPDEYRATLYTDQDGSYRFECPPTDHIHMRISAPEYRTLASNAYHTEGRAEGVFDIVLVQLD